MSSELDDNNATLMYDCQSGSGTDSDGLPLRRQDAFIVGPTSPVSPPDANAETQRTATTPSELRAAHSQSRETFDQGLEVVQTYYHMNGSHHLMGEDGTIKQMPPGDPARFEQWILRHKLIDTLMEVRNAQFNVESTAMWNRGAYDGANAMLAGCALTGSPELVIVAANAKTVLDRTIDKHKHARAEHAAHVRRFGQWVYNLHALDFPPEYSERVGAKWKRDPDDAAVAEQGNDAVDED